MDQTITNAETQKATPPATLYLRIGDGDICFARYEARRDTFFEFAPYAVRPNTSLAVNLREAKTSEPILAAPIRKVQVLVVGPTTLVPLADFQEEDCETLYNYTFPSDTKRRVFYDVLPSANAVLLFALEETTCRTLEEEYGNVHYVSGLTPVLRHFSAKGVSAAKRLFAYVHGETLSVAVFEENKLVVANTYRIGNPVDAAYYVFNVASHQAMKPEEAAFFVAGTAEERESISTELRKYASSVFTVNPAGEYNRHIVAMTPEVPYDLMTLLLDI